MVFGVPTAHGKWSPKNSPLGKRRGIWKLCQNTLFLWYAQVVNTLILKVKDIANSAAEYFFSSSELSVCEVSFAYEIFSNY